MGLCDKRPSCVYGFHWNAERFSTRARKWPIKKSEDEKLSIHSKLFLLLRSHETQPSRKCFYLFRKVRAPGWSWFIASAPSAIRSLFSLQWASLSSSSFKLRMTRLMIFHMKLHFHANLSHVLDWMCLGCCARRNKRFHHINALSFSFRLFSFSSKHCVGWCYR